MSDRAERPPLKLFQILGRGLNWNFVPKIIMQTVVDRTVRPKHLPLPFKKEKRKKLKNKIEMRKTQ